MLSCRSVIPGVIKTLGIYVSLRQEGIYITGRVALLVADIIVVDHIFVATFGSIVCLSVCIY